MIFLNTYSKINMLCMNEIMRNEIHIKYQVGAKSFIIDNVSSFYLFACDTNVLNDSIIYSS